MRRKFAGLLLVLPLLAPQLACAEAKELGVAHSIVIAAPAERVWEVAGDFVGVPRWLTTIPSSRLVLGKNREAGCIRELTRANGTKVQEKLIEYDPWNMTMTYTYVGGQPLVSHYFATVKVTALDGARSRVDWSARFKRLDYWTEEPPPGQEDETLVGLFNRIYSGGLESLRKVVEAQ
jgi:uncharacterized protein YndB with AHSA1/START domain